MDRGLLFKRKGRGRLHFFSTNLLAVTLAASTVDADEGLQVICECRAGPTAAGLVPEDELWLVPDLEDELKQRSCVKVLGI